MAAMVPIPWPLTAESVGIGLSGGLVRGLVLVPMSVTATPEIHKRIVGVLRFYLRGEDD